ncbi:MAG: DMT family transporter, partial [Desulfobacteraceae bacterium]|nr:DMT family transporter [Desulfobacteraceae bacterium]
FQLGVVSPELSVAYRFGLSAAILLVFSLLRRLPLRFGWRAQAFMALQGLFLFSMNYILVYLAEGYLTSGMVAIIFSMIVILNVIFGAVFLRNPVRINVVVGALVGFASLTLVFWPELSSFDFSSERALGVGLTFLGATSASLGNIISARNQRHNLPVVQTNAFGMAYGAVFMLALALFRGAQLSFDPSAGYVLSLLYLVLFGSVIAFYTYLTLLGRIGPDRAAYVTVLFPIIALLLSTLFEGMTWSLLQLAGVGLVLLGNAAVLVRARSFRAPKSVDGRPRLRQG